MRQIDFLNQNRFQNGLDLPLTWEREMQGNDFLKNASSARGNTISLSVN